MAKIRPGGSGVDFSGSIGSETYSRNRYGSYVRYRSRPVNPNSEAQLASRAILAAAARDWSSLTDAQRAAWKMYADNTPVTDRFGFAITLTGAAMYTKVNAARLSAGLPTLSAAPTTYGLPSADPSFSVVVTAADTEMEVTFDNTQEWCTAVGGRLLVYAGRPQNPNITYYGGPYKQITGVSGAVVAPTSPAPLTLPYAIAAGQIMWVQYRILTAEGRLSNPFRVGPVVAG